MNYLKLLFSVCSVVIISFLGNDISAQSDNHNAIHEEKLSLSFGIGHEYSLIGFRLNYLVSEDLSLMAGFSPWGLVVNGELGESYAKAGIEYRFSNLVNKKRLLPYANILFGVGKHIRINYFDEVNQQRIFGINTSYGPTLGIGTKFKLFKKMRSYGNIGIQYVIYNRKKQMKFVDDFNSQYGTNWYFRSRDVFFSLGYTFILKSKKPPAKN